MPEAKQTETLEHLAKKRLWHYLDTSVAIVAGTSVDGLQRFLSGTDQMTPAQIEGLARRMRLT